MHKKGGVTVRGTNGSPQDLKTLILKNNYGL